MFIKNGRIVLPLLVVLAVMSACSPSVSPTAMAVPTNQSNSANTASLLSAIDHAPNVPALPFADNLDPSQCGIPTPWTSNTSAFLTSVYKGILIEPIVFLYDSHLRQRVVASAPNGAEVKILMAEQNPTLNYYMVEIVDASPPNNEGWVPAPFVTFDAPAFF
ncbi:MAG: SH3 domain-containing protein [Aggregatilineales bacterium]